MISIEFFRTKGALSGFRLSGHGTADEDDFEGRLICSAVSSAVYMAANTLLEIMGADATVNDDGDVFSLQLSSKIPESQPVLEGFRLHLTELGREYSQNIEIISEVF